MELELAWLAGFWDGEGSVGISVSKGIRVLTCQLSHTEIDSVKNILRILKVIGVNGRGYTYCERDPKIHRDAHHIRVGGMANILIFANHMLPYAVTKKRHWEIAIEWAERRIKISGGVGKDGRLFRGGDAKLRPYSDDDFRLEKEMHLLNRRGPEDRATRQRGRIRDDEI